MRVEVLQEFVHGDIEAVIGRELDLTDSLAGDLERSGLVRIKAPLMAPREPQGKIPPAGAAPLSSVSPAGQVLPQTTAPSLKRGNVKIRPLGR